MVVILGYPVFGDLYNREDAGFFAVDTDQKFENDGSDPEGILKGEYAVNNIKSDPESVLYDPVSGVLLSGQTMIPDITTVGDIPSNLALLKSFPKFEIWQDYCIQDPIINEQFGFKYVYFKNGYPISSMNETPPSGDLLFNHFYSKLNRFTGPDYGDGFTYANPIVSAEFGTTFTDPIQPQYSYDVETKTLIISGEFNRDNDYISYIGSEINSTSGITQTISVRNKREDYPIHLKWVRTLDQDFNYIPDNDINDLLNANVWKYPADSQDEFVQFVIQIETYRNKLKEIKKRTKFYWDKLNIEPIDEDNKMYQLTCEDPKYYKLLQTLKTNLDGITTFQEKQCIVLDDIEYNVLVNNYLYFILTDDPETDGIYDWGIVDMPHFATYRNPIFNITLPNCNTVFGVSIDTNILYVPVKKD